MRQLSQKRSKGKWRDMDRETDPHIDTDIDKYRYRDLFKLNTLVCM